MNTSPAAQDSLSLVGRALLALLFIPAGWAKIGGFAGTAGYIASKGIPFPELCAAIAIGAELGLGLLLLVGFQARWAALGLAIFTIVITPIFHNFWVMADAARVSNMQAFFKNFAAVGGLLMVVAYGPGGFSIDGKPKTNR